MMDIIKETLFCGSTSNMYTNFEGELSVIGGIFLQTTA